MLKISGIVVAVLLVIVLAVVGVAAMRPDEFRVERSQTIEAPPEELSAILSDFQRWPSWSPYEKLDPEMKRSFSGPSQGVGAIYAWDGNGNVGKGQMKLTEATTERVTMDLDFERPFKGHNIAQFTLKPTGDSTIVTWSIDGKQALMCKVMSLFMDMDSMCGQQFEEGLANLKQVAEQED